MSDKISSAKEKRIEDLARKYGIQAKRAGANEVKIVCPHPNHNDTDASCYINTQKNVFQCHGCGWAGSAIDFVMGIECVPIQKAIDILNGESESLGAVKPPSRSKAKEKKYRKESQYQSGRWDYCDANGNKVYASIRYDFPDGTKEFDLKHFVDGKLEFGLPSEIERVPLHLDQFPDHQEVWFVEGEKCSDILNSLGIFATNIAGGSNAKLDGIARHFKGMDVVLLPDNDKGGREFMNAFAHDLWEVANSTRILDVGTPRNEKGYDIHDKIKDFEKEGMTKAQIVERITIMKDASLYLVDGEPAQILDYRQREAEYRLMLTLDGFDLGDFIPALKGVLRPFIPGDCLLIAGDTGSGKTSMLTGIASWAAPMTILNFNIELSTGVYYEREASTASEIPAHKIEELYREGSQVNVGNSLSHIYTVPLSRVTPDTIRDQFWKFVKLTGLWPEWVFVDYVQLLKGMGSRYERTTDNAEEIRILAKELYTRFAFTSQKARPTDKKAKQEDVKPTLHGAKDSGALENSASVYMDLRPHPVHPDVKKGVILKNTRGPAGVEFDIGWIGACTKFVAGGLKQPDQEPELFDGKVTNHATPDDYKDDGVPF